MSPHDEEIAHEVAMGEHRDDGPSDDDPMCVCGHYDDEHRLDSGDAGCGACSCDWFEEE